MGFIRSFKGFLCRAAECHVRATKALCIRCKLNRGKTDRFKTNIDQLNCASFDCRYTFQLFSGSQQVKPQRFYRNIQNSNTQPITKHYKFSNTTRFSNIRFSISTKWKRCSSFPTCGVRPAPLSMDNAVISLGLRRSGREAKHSPQSAAKVKKEWSYTSTDTNVDLLGCRYFGVNYRCHLQGTSVHNTVNQPLHYITLRQIKQTEG